jgi:hypothetical protein
VTKYVTVRHKAILMDVETTIRANLRFRFLILLYWLRSICFNPLPAAASLQHSSEGGGGDFQKKHEVAEEAKCYKL